MKPLAAAGTALFLSLSLSLGFFSLWPAALAGAAESSTTVRTSAPNTDDCPRQLTPPEPVTTSEALRPGQAAPTPLPATQTSRCGVDVPPGFDVRPDVVASAWIVVDIDSGDIIAQKDPHGRYRPASIIKVLLALEAIDNLDLQQRVRATAADAGVQGSAVGLGEDGEYTVEQLLQGLILASGNDAARTLAGQLGGDAATLEKVNARARALGARDTYAASYSGLDAPGMSTSVTDMALIYQAAFRNPTFARIANTESVPFPGYQDRPGYQLWNDNGLFMNDPDGIGGKTGFTDDANHTFVGALDRGGRRLLAVLLDTTVDHGTRAWQQAQALLHEAYDTPGTVGSLAGAAATPTSTSSAPTSAAPSTAPRSSTPPSGVSPTTVPVDATPHAAASASTPPWVGWLVVALVALLALSVASFSLLRR